MPDLSLEVESARAVPDAAAPCLGMTLRISNRPEAEEIASISLQCQVRIAPERRRYAEEEREGLRELFGLPEQWSRTVTSFLWTHAQVVVPAFRGACRAELSLPCTYDFNVAAAKYFHALREGEVPVLLLFSGTVFYRVEGGALQISPVPWSKEASFRLPVQAWKELMERWYPNSAVLRLRRDVFDRLHRFKVERGLPTFDQAMEALLERGG
jgi:hypothetical protein